MANKPRLTRYQGTALLQEFAPSHPDLIVVGGNSCCSTNGNLHAPEIPTHSHDEVETLIPLHALDAVNKNDVIRSINLFSGRKHFRLASRYDFHCYKLVGLYTFVRLLTVEVCQTIS